MSDTLLVRQAPPLHLSPLHPTEPEPLIGFVVLLEWACERTGTEKPATDRACLVSQGQSRSLPSVEAARLAAFIGGEAQFVVLAPDELPEDAGKRLLTQARQHTESGTLAAVWPRVRRTLRHRLAEQRKRAASLVEATNALEVLASIAGHLLASALAAEIQAVASGEPVRSPSELVQLFSEAGEASLADPGD